MSQEINSCHKKSIIVKRTYLWLSLIYQLAALLESYQKFYLSKYISWEPEYAALSECVLLVYKRKYTCWSFSYSKHSNILKKIMNIWIHLCPFFLMIQIYYYPKFCIFISKYQIFGKKYSNLQTYSNICYALL